VIELRNWSLRLPYQNHKPNYEAHTDPTQTKQDRKNKNKNKTATFLLIFAENFFTNHIIVHTAQNK